MFQTNISYPPARAWRDVARELARETSYTRVQLLTEELDRAIAEQDPKLVAGHSPSFVSDMDS